VVYDPTWHKGVIGIVASRLMETYYRPTLVFTKSGDYLAASARSVKGFDVYDALEQCSEFIDQFGGHMYAAGLTLKEENYEAFKNRFEEVVCATIKNQSRSEEISIDCQLPLNSITDKFYRILQQMAPFGPRNMTPVFMTEKVMDTGYGKTVGADGDHLKLCVTSKSGKAPKLNAIGFNLGSKCELVKGNSTFNVAYSIDQNVWQGTTTLQLRLRDLQ
jgi:single-stranded-DNA-specific exonuclease